MPVIKLGGISQLGAITGFSGFITKVEIDDILVYPGTRSIELEEGKTIGIRVYYSVTPLGDIGFDYWTVGVSCTMAGQFGHDNSKHEGPGTETGNPVIGNLKVPATDSTLTIKLWAIDAHLNVPAPPG